jgi:drug/metabolite transporter (DMT)-like permease
VGHVDALRPVVVRIIVIMFAALLATTIWTFSSLTSACGARHLGGISANLVRLLIAVPFLLLGSVALGTMPWVAWQQTGGGWFVWSGVIGMGICDIMMLSAYARLGARVTSLVVNALAAPIAAVFGWLALAEHPTLTQALVMAGIIAAVALVLRPRAGDRADLLGLCCAVGGAIAFAGASVMSRIGFTTAVAAGTPIHWLDSTIVRVGAGVVLCVIVFVVAGQFAQAWRDGPARWRQAVPWLAANAVLGPFLGLGCYQWALSTATAAEVHAVVAVLPALVLVLTWMLGGEPPDRWAIVGTLLAVAGVVALALLR